MTDLSLVVAGGELVASLDAERERCVPRNEVGLFKSDPLCRLQEAQARRGILGAELVKSLYGWGVRFDSGLQDWGIIVSARSGMVDGSFADAVRAARAWQAEDASRRYVTCREDARSELQAVEVVS